MSAEAPVAVLVRLTIKVEREDAFRSELRNVLERVRREPDCLSIEGHQDPEDRTRFMLYEVWRSREAFDEFESGREYLQSYMARIRPWWSEPRDLSVWDRVA